MTDTATVIVTQVAAVDENTIQVTTLGVQGLAGVGVSSGGTAGQTLAKVDGTAYNTHWITPVAQTPWTSHIDGAGFHIKNANLFDNGLNGTIGKSVDAINHVLWSADFGSGSVPFIDFSGNGGGGSVTAGSYIIFDRGEQNIAFFKPLADTHYNVSLNVGDRQLFDSRGVNSGDYEGRALIGYNNDLLIDWNGNGVSGAVLSFASQRGYFLGGVDLNGQGINNTGTIYSAGDINLGYGNNIHFAMGGGGAIDGVGTIYANHFSGGGFSGDGSALSNIAYSGLSGAPIDSSANFTSDIHASGYSFYMPSGSYVRDGSGVVSIAPDQRQLCLPSYGTAIIDYSGNFQGSSCAISVSPYGDVQIGSNLYDANGIERWSPLNMVFYGSGSVLDLNNGEVFTGGGIPVMNFSGSPNSSFGLSFNPNYYNGYLYDGWFSGQLFVGDNIPSYSGDEGCLNLTEAYGGWASHIRFTRPYVNGDARIALAGDGLLFKNFNSGGGVMFSFRDYADTHFWDLYTGGFNGFGFNNFQYEQDGQYIVQIGLDYSQYSLHCYGYSRFDYPIQDNNGYSSIDTISRLLDDTTGTHAALDWSNRLLLANDGTTRNINWTGSSDSSSALSFDSSKNTLFSQQAKLAGSTTSRASLNIASGSAPTSPNSGDIWFDGTNLKMRVGGTTKTFTLT